MWALAVTRGACEFFVRDQLHCAGLSVFLPYTREKRVITVTPPRTTSTPRPRAQHVVSWINVALWPGYIFAQVRRSEDLNTLSSARGVSTLVKNGEGEPSTLTEQVMDILRKDCAPDGQVLKTSSLHGYKVGDLLRFVAKSNLAGHTGVVQSIEDNGDLRLLVDAQYKVTAHYSELTSAIG